MLKIATNPKKNCRNDFQEENLRLSNRINSGEFDDLGKFYNIPISKREIALLLLLVRKAQNNRTSNTKRSKKRTSELEKLQLYFEAKLKAI